MHYVIFSKSIGRYLFTYRNNIVRVPITEPTKPPKKFSNNPDFIIVSSFFSSSQLGESTTFKR